MRKKGTAALFFALTLLIAVPFLRADPIRAPTNWDFDDGSIGTVSVSTLTEMYDNTLFPPTDNANVISIFALRWDREHHWDSGDPSPVPEPGTLAPLLVLAAGLLYFRKRLVGLP